MIVNEDILRWCEVYTGEKFHAVLCDPPYELGFMGKSWDSTGIAFDKNTWAAISRHLHPGAYLLAFGGTRTFHRIAVAIEDAGFEIRDTVMWVYGSGFPKSHDVSKAIDREAGAEREMVRDYNPRNPKATGGGKDGAEGATRPWIEKAMEVGYHEKAGNKPATEKAEQWSGYGTALKPSWEPIIIARKPLEGTVAQNTQKYGSGALNIDGCRVGTETVSVHDAPKGTFAGGEAGRGSDTESYREHQGRWPANLIHDGSDEVVGMFPKTGSPRIARTGRKGGNKGALGEFGGSTPDAVGTWPADNGGSAARFFMSCASEQSDSIMSVCPNTPASSVLGFLITIPVTTGSSALTSAEVLLCEQLVPNVKSAGVQCERCATSIAHELVRIKTQSSGKDLRATLASTPDFANSIPQQNLVSIVEEWQSTDIIPTTENLLRLFGYVLLATDAPTNQESQDFANAQVKATRFLYSAKVSKRERDAGLDIPEKSYVQFQTANGTSGKPSSISEGRETAYRNHHPTLKPISLTTYLAKLILPPKLDKPRRLLVPFAGSGSEVIGGFKAGWDEVVGVEQDAEYCKIAEARVKHWTHEEGGKHYQDPLLKD